MKIINKKDIKNFQQRHKLISILQISIDFIKIKLFYIKILLIWFYDNFNIITRKN